MAKACHFSGLFRLATVQFSRYHMRDQVDLDSITHLACIRVYEAEYSSSCNEGIKSLDNHITHISNEIPAFAKDVDSNRKYQSLDNRHPHYEYSYVD